MPAALRPREVEREGQGQRRLDGVLACPKGSGGRGFAKKFAVAGHWPQQKKLVMLFPGVSALHPSARATSSFSAKVAPL